MIKETRKLSWYDVRKMCIRENFYTCGTCEEYDKLYEYVEELEEVTTENIVYIAKDIMAHSEVDSDMELTTMCFLIGRECKSFFEEVEEAEEEKYFYEVNTEFWGDDYHTATIVYKQGGLVVFGETVEGTTPSEEAFKAIEKYNAEEVEL